MPNESNLKPFTSENQPKKNGRPKGRKNWSTLFKKYSKIKLKMSDLKDMKIDLPIDYEDTKELSIQDIIAMRLIYKAMTKADYKDIELLINRMDGLLKQGIEHSGQIGTSNIDEKINEIENNINGNTDN